MGLRVLGAVGMALDRNMRHRALQFVPVDPMRAAIPGGELREHAGRRQVRPVHRVGDAARPLRQAAIAGVFQLFAPQRQRDVAGAGRHRIDRAPHRLGAARAKILDPRHRDEGKPQRHGKRHAARPHIDRLNRGREPGGLNVVLFDTRVVQAFGERLDHQVERLRIPALAEFRAAHAEDRNLVPNACRHDLYSSPPVISAVLSARGRRPSAPLSRNTCGSPARRRIRARGTASAPPRRCRKYRRPHR